MTTAVDPRFHLAWFKSFTPHDWRGPWAGPEDREWMNGDSHVDFLQALERARFDFLMLEDSLMVSDTYAGTAEASLAQGGYAPKGDPALLASMLLSETTRIGVIATMSSTFVPPWLLARTSATIDHLSGGRFGWNCVTSSENRAAQNFGMDALPPHDERYERAAEYVDLVKQLWDSWEDGALVMDEETNTYVDHTKVRPIHFEGRWHRSRGPLNLMRPPQGHPVICQAGGSPAGKAFAAANADVLLALPKGLADMKRYRDDIRELAVEAGRDPDDIKVMFIVSPILADTDEEARELQALMNANAEAKIKAQMVNWSATMEIDFSRFDLDEPLPDDASTNGHQSTLSTFRKFAAGRTLREAFTAYRTESIEVVGSPATAADVLQEAMEFVGGDGFLIMGGTTNRRYVHEITDGLVPELQRRGLVRTEYAGAHLRDHLREF
ncbi:NtaA/DmoA family FMN-dependent monooxygenase [Pseudonocardia kujensis]|uniref:NtaA/DmoA family FMN-dependent monooxygenase n=1 Tax=Pseudonocardia kujensis TaxID=1128675 RepID=UPI001E469E7A|nr:NtaA/DmoA family FMN-dependent monooxygenase [Pseudonocardia kujensis]MCE0766862.1 NtaA/DmoA family FMN-dependent monooxygenase [Pseudonocardia kujensis]